MSSFLNRARCSTKKTYNHEEYNKLPYTINIMKQITFSYLLKHFFLLQKIKLRLPLHHKLKLKHKKGKINSMNCISVFSFAETRRSELVLISELQARFYGKLQFLKNCNILRLT